MSFMAFCINFLVKFVIDFLYLIEFFQNKLELGLKSLVLFENIILEKLHFLKNIFKVLFEKYFE